MPKPSRWKSRVQRARAARALALAGLAALLGACAAGPSPAPAPSAGTPPTATVAAPPTAPPPSGPPAEVVVNAADMAEDSVYELEVWEDAASPGGTLLGVTNFGGDLDPPPENDPHVAFSVPVRSGVPYRCWVRMRVGAPKGVSQANVLYVQFASAVDDSGAPILRPQSDSFLTARGPEEEGWAWVGCDLDGAPATVAFAADGETGVRIQAGMEGVGFDQFVLSPAAYLDGPPAGDVVEKP